MDTVARNARPVAVRIGDHTLLWAQAPVLVLLTSFVAVDTGRHCDADCMVPVPCYDLVVSLRVFLQPCAAPLPCLGEVFRQLRFGQAVRHQQPPMVSDHNHLLPSVVQETSHPIGKSSKLGGGVMGDLPPMFVAVCVDAPRLQPGAPGNVAKLFSSQDLEARIAHHPPQRLSGDLRPVRLYNSFEAFATY